MKRKIMVLVWFLAVLPIFFFTACRQTPFEGAAPKNGLVDVMVKFEGGDYKSVYWPGARSMVLDPVSSKQRAVSVKVLAADKNLNVKINNRKISPSENNALEFIEKVRLLRGNNIIPINIAYSESGEGESFNIQIQKKDGDGALRLVHLRYEYDGVKSDDLSDEFSFEGFFERKFVAPRQVKLEVGTPHMDVQRVEIGSGSDLQADPHVPSQNYLVYTFDMDQAGPTYITIYAKDKIKDKEQKFTMKFSLMDEDEASSAKIKSVKAITEYGSVLDFSKLDMYGLKPYVKGSVRNKPITISNIFKLKDFLFAPIDGNKLTVSVEPEQPGAKVKLIAKWDEIDHDTSKYKISRKHNWNTNDLITDINQFRTRPSAFEVVLGPDTDTEFKITPYNSGKMSLLLEVTSPNGKVKKYHEVKFALISRLAEFFDMEIVKADTLIRTLGDGGKVFALMKAVEGENKYQVFVPAEAKSAMIVADDTFQINWATNYRQSYVDIWDGRYYIKIDDGDFSRIHPPESVKINFKEIKLSDTIPKENHKVSIVMYQDGMLKDGKFVDEYGNESGVKKIQADFDLEFIREDKNIAPALSVLKFEGTVNPAPINPHGGYINGKTYPVMSFRPAVSDYKMPLVKNGVDYKLLMLKTDPQAEIIIDGVLSDGTVIAPVKVTATTTVPQKNYNAGSNNFPEPSAIHASGSNADVIFSSFDIPNEFKDASGNIKEGTLKIIIKKGNSFREYNIQIVPLDPNENETEVLVVSENSGSHREGISVYFVEHDGTKELPLKMVGTDKKFDESAGGYNLLGTTDSNGKILSKGKLKAGKYYDLYAVGNNSIADSRIENYYVKGLPKEPITIVQQPLLQNGGSDYNSGLPIRGNSPVILKKSGDGIYFYTREIVKGGLGGSSGAKTIKPINLSYGNAHLKLDGESNLTDMVMWFDIINNNSIEPVAWGGYGACVCIDSSPSVYTYKLEFNEHSQGKVSMNENAVKQIERFRYDFPSGTFTFVIVAYDVAGNRLERHQFVSIESVKSMNGVPIGDSEQLKIEEFGVRLFRFPQRSGLFEAASGLEKLFGVPYTEYLPSPTPGNPNPQKKKLESSYIAIAKCVLFSGRIPIPVSGVDLYRRCVDDGGDFRRVSSTINSRRATRFGCIDGDSRLEEGKTYQYKMIAFTDEGHALETEYVSEITVPPAFVYHLDRITVEGQGGKDDKTGESLEGKTMEYTYNTEKVDEVPILQMKKYPKHTPEEDKKKLEIEYTIKLSSSSKNLDNSMLWSKDSELWSKSMADEISFGLCIYKRNGDIVHGSKGVIVFEDEEPMLYIYSPLRGRYMSLDALIKAGDIPSTESFESLLKLKKVYDEQNELKTCYLTFTKNYMAVNAINWTMSYTGEPLKYEAGNTYYWDSANWFNAPLPSKISPMTFVKNFEAKKKTAPHEKYQDDDGNNVESGMYLVLGNTWSAGSNALNGRCRFTVIEEK